MVNTPEVVGSVRLARASKLGGVYVVVVVVTIGALVVLSRTDPAQATQEGWVHAAIVAVFAVLLPVRLRAARRGSHRAVPAVGVIATVLSVVNVVEAVIPGLFPIWMRVEMVGIAVLMAAVAALALGRR